jgi:hypothetical protein
LRQYKKIVEKKLIDRPHASLRAAEMPPSPRRYHSARAVV